MNKSDLIELVANKKGCTVYVAKKIVDEIFSSMTDALSSGDRIEVRGFGSLVVKQFESYIGRNPRTGVSTVVAAKKLPYFKVGKKLGRLINSWFTM